MTRAQASLFGQAPAARGPRVAVPIATTADLERRRLVQIYITGAHGPKRGWIMRPSDKPADALLCALTALRLTPEAISVGARPETPHTVEVRLEAGRDTPRHIAALIPEGLNIAEARLALDTLRNPRKGVRR